MLEQVTDRALEQHTETVNCGNLNSGSTFSVKGGDGAAVQAGEARNVADPKLFATHERRQMTTNHDEFGYGGDA